MHNVPEQDPRRRNPYCGDPGALVSYLYNDGAPDELAAIAAHVESCDPCTRELALLGDTREQLAGWAPPSVALDFTFPSEAASVESLALKAPLPWWRQSTPVWMQAMAATLVFGAGLAVGVSGRGATSTATNASAGAPVVSHTDLAALEQRLRGELARLSTPPAATASNVAVRPNEPGRDEALLKQVRTLLTDSEERQRRELAMRTAQVLRDAEIQRKVDMAQMQQTMGELSGTTGAEFRRQQEMFNLLINNASLRGRP
jgi:hypothetical protein